MLRGGLKLDSTATICITQAGVASLGVGEVMNDTPLVLKGCMTVVALSLHTAVYVCTGTPFVQAKGEGWRWQGVLSLAGESISQLKGNVDGGWTLLHRATVVVMPLLLVHDALRLWKHNQGLEIPFAMKMGADG